MEIIWTSVIWASIFDIWRYAMGEPLKSKLTHAIDPWKGSEIVYHIPELMSACPRRCQPWIPALLEFTTIKGLQLLYVNKEHMWNWVLELNVVVLHTCLSVIHPNRCLLSWAYEHQSARLIAGTPRSLTPVCYADKILQLSEYLEHLMLEIAFYEFSLIDRSFWNALGFIFNHMVLFCIPYLLHFLMMI